MGQHPFRSVGVESKQEMELHSSHGIQMLNK